MNNEAVVIENNICERILTHKRVTFVAVIDINHPIKSILCCTIKLLHSIQLAIFTHSVGESTLPQENA